MMGIVSDSEFEKELGILVPAKKENLISFPEPTKGRPEDKKNVPPVIRSIIAEEALCGASVTDITEKYNTSPSSISAYKHDATSTASYHKPDKELKKNNDSLREEITSTARDRLMAALRGLDSDKINSAKARDIAGIAKDMSGIIKNMEPVTPINNNIQQVLVYKPRMREEDDFEVIEVNE